MERVPNEGLAFVERVCGLPEGVRLEGAESVVISTQVTVGEGRPDIEVRSGTDTLVYVKVKHDAPLGAGQLEYYLAKLEEAPEPNTHLVLLTRSRASSRETTLDRNNYHHVCWYEIHNRLATTAVGDEVCRYLIDGFMRFLEEKEMSMEKVSREYIEGAPALLNLTKMMEVSVIEAVPDANRKRTAGWDWRGFNLDGRYFYGIRHQRPLLVVFENNLGTSPTYKRDLALDEVGFFSLSKNEQFETLVEFLRRARDDAAPAPMEGGLGAS